MAVRQYAFHFNLSEGCIVFLSAVVSFLLVFAFGIYIGKEVQAYKTAQETRTVRFPVENIEPQRSMKSDARTPRMVVPPPAPREQTQRIVPPLSGSQSPVLSVNESQGRSKDKKEEREAEIPDSTKTQTQSNPKGSTQQGQKEQMPVPGGWRIQVHVTKSPGTAKKLATDLRQQGYRASINTLVRNGEVLYRLRVGGFTQEEAQRVAARFRREGKFTQAYLVSE